MFVTGHQVLDHKSKVPHHSDLQNSDRGEHIGAITCHFLAYKREARHIQSGSPSSKLTVDASIGGKMRASWPQPQLAQRGI